MLSGMLFLSIAILALLAGAPPSSGVEILAWTAAHAHLHEAENELLFFAAVALVPAVIALYRSLAHVDIVKAALGCGVIAVVIPIFMMLLIIQARFVYPVYGIRVATPEIAELVVALFFGGLHATALLLGGATFVLSLAMKRAVYGRGIAYLGMVTGVLDIVAGYPWLIGPIPTFICGVFFAGWFAAVGWTLYRIHG